MEKFRYFIAFLENGKNVTLKAPNYKVTEKTAQMYASHWLKIQKGITGVDIKRIEGCIIID